MSPQDRSKGEFPLGGTAPWRQGGRIHPQDRSKGEFPLGGTARSAKGVQ
jgi:hypothetical protein